MNDPIEEKTSPLRTRRGIYLLPNLFTTAALFSGFYAIVAAMQGSFDSAAMAIFIAILMDSLDGRVARLTNTQSEFGAQYDSLSDMVSFGIAPALVVYSWSIHTLGKIGWLVAFLYTATAALRLARFNVQTLVVDKRFFVGLPSPAAAAVVAGWVGVAHQLALSPQVWTIITSLLTVAVGLLMVSSVHYASFKQFSLHGKVPFIAALIVLLVFMAVSVDPPVVVFSLFLIYVCSGPVLAVRRWWRHRLYIKRPPSPENKP